MSEKKCITLLLMIALGLALFIYASMTKSGVAGGIATLFLGGGAVFGLDQMREEQVRHAECEFETWWEERRA